MPDSDEAVTVVEKQTYYAVACAILLSIALILSAAAIAIERRCAHDFSRSGSLLVIISLALVAYQFLYETAAEKRREAIVQWLENQKQMDLRFTLDLNEIDPEKRAAHLIHSLIWRSRLTIVITSVGIGSVGEIIHGFGDLLIEFAAGALLTCHHPAT